MFVTEKRPLPSIGNTACGIYTGKYTDRSPQITAAGKLTSVTGDDAKTCLTLPTDRPESPETVRRFRAALQPDAGCMRVFYSKAYDPHRKWAEEMVHGVHMDPSYTAGELLNPRPKSLFQQKIYDKKEDIYHSHIRYPLGQSHDQRKNLPRELDPSRVVFGVKTHKDGSAGELVSPDKTYQEVDQEYDSGRDLYIKSHRSYSAGQQISRNYRTPNFNVSLRFGIGTPHANDGRHVRKTMKWMSETQAEKATPLVAKRLDDFRERTQPQLGRTLDPIKDTMNVPDNHTFGAMVKPDGYGAGDLLHGRTPGNYLRGRDRIRGILAAIRHSLKKVNYHNFPGLLQAFQFYDKGGSGKITMGDLREACLQFNLPVEAELLVQLMDSCDVNRDGLIDYNEFLNFLNWKDKFPEDFPHDKVPRGGEDEATKEEPRTPQLATPRRLEQQIDRAITDQRPTSTMINAVVGGVPTSGFRRYGTPTIRSDLPAPLIKRVSDTTNYGDEPNAQGLMNPNVYGRRGVYERDFLEPRSKDEIHRVFTSVGVNLDGETFDRTYEKAAATHPKGYVSVQTFRDTLGDVIKS